MKKRTQNKLRRMLYSGSKPIFFTSENLNAANALIAIIRSLFGCEKPKGKHKKRR